MSLKDWKIRSFYFEFIGCIQYIILIFTAMFFYPGGTEKYPNAPGYSFWANSLSDLGRTVSYSGQINAISMILFSVALFIWAFSLIPFFIYLTYSVSETDLQRNISYIGQISGVIAGIGLIGIV
ncbi:MAG: hypothetical protein GF383_02600, partial [Candidatus Lokiarchaeota archaeon]|nr:hypothetical protein [Candidatus Lokiarchaeota archaeon]MBD3338322.1 hypothetical protein [Candidatus Lokiarchaeota archaeon]